ncbi:hypothetical protein ASG72_11130 [Bosea sp. Leaf344]|uniref:vWA domain-containing protein n=1 Tax=Bosea sp. Leaf344 TaxID=1736346 RepID=UPI0006F9FE40|nr:VWA domain-containing protein [Bosea sp. Leaf344]KQU52027.1 hypothetical protein ASG72_11130 [Bosea sp. Leaf344]
MTGKLPENIAYFARALRIAGVAVGPGAVIEAVEALADGALGGREDVYWALHAIFVKKHEDSLLYDQAFRLFWRRRALIEKLMAQMSPVSPGADAQPEKAEAGALRVAEAFAPPRREDREPPTELTELTARLTVSDRETLKSRDFAQMSAAEIARAKQLIAQLRLPIDTVPTRRFRPAQQGRRIDPRATFRRSLRGGGGTIDLAFRERAEIHPPVVALVDISGSMAEYSRIFLHFLHAITEKRRVHSFVFGTRLTNITRMLRARDPDEALALAGRAAPDWEGGTRISTALHAFNRVWSRRVLSGGAVVLLFTDGLERHLDGQLGFEMDRLHRSCRQLVWLNPLLRFDAFEARASGIRAMLPHVDSFRPIHNLAAMADLCAALSPDAERKSDPRQWLKRAS